MLRRLVALPLVAVLACACAPTYRQDARSRRIALTSKGYVKEGKTFPAGLLRGTLKEMVRGVPEAEAAASRMRWHGIWSVVLVFPASFCTAGAIPILAGTIEREEDATGLLIATPLCVAALVAGVALAFSSERYHWDAINIYNERIDPP
jgi:hypothetical protein